MLPATQPAAETIPPPEVVLIDDAMTWCEGNGPAYGHPRVYLRIGATGFADCGYCDRRFILKGGAGDVRDDDKSAVPGRDDLSPGALSGDPA